MSKMWFGFRVDNCEEAETGFPFCHVVAAADDGRALLICSGSVGDHEPMNKETAVMDEW
jgi:hypothetical protein